jgi:eukaryotic-like serine/threonine-protein kinase
VALLGAGGMGEVYRAHDPRIGRDVAIKVLPQSVADDPERLRRFEREARAAGALSHPNLLTVFELGNHEGSPYIVTELLEGTTLARLLRPPSLVDPFTAGKPPLPLRLIVDYAAQIANGLAAAHEKGIVHRDLKPENIVVTEDGRLKLLDFGLAKIVALDEEGEKSDRTTTPGAIVGTTGYMAPEQVRGKVVDHRADVFAFGAVLYQMITGVEPFRRESPAETLSAILSADPPPVPAGSVPLSLVRVCEHALAKSPSMRFQSMRDVAFTLEMLGSSENRSAALPPSAKAREQSEVTFSRVTFRRGFIMSARFAPDGWIVYGAAWEDQPLQVFATHAGNPEARPSGVMGDVLSVSKNADLALSIGRRYIINHVTSGVLARVPMSGGAPREICDAVQNADWTPDGKDLLVTRAVGDRYRIELPIGHVIYESPMWLSGARVSPNGELIAFSENPVLGDDAGSVVVIDRSGKVRMRTALLWSVSSLAWTPASDEVWCSEQGLKAGRDIVGFSLNGKRRTVLAAPGAFRIQDISPHGRALVTFDHARREIVGGTRGETRERNLSWFDWSFLAGLTPDGSRIVFEEQGAARHDEFASSIYIRPTDGGPGVHLCEGRARAITPDGRAVVVMTGSPPQLTIVPTGAGEARPLDIPGMRTFVWGEFDGEGKLLVVLGSFEGSGERLHAIDLGNAVPPRPISPEGVSWPFAVSPDGRMVAASHGDRLMLFPIAGGEPRVFKDVRAGASPIAWTPDGSAVFTVRRVRATAEIERIDIANESRTLWLTICPADQAGILDLNPVKITPNGEYYVYGFRRFLSDLFIVNGLLP